MEMFLYLCAALAALACAFYIATMAVIEIRSQFPPKVTIDKDSAARWREIAEGWEKLYERLILDEDLTE